MRSRSKRRLCLSELVSGQQLIRDIRLLQNGDVLSGTIKLLLRPENLQSAACPTLILDCSFGAQRLQAVAAIFRQSNHTVFVDGVALRSTVLQHLPHPLELELFVFVVWPYCKGSVLLEHPFHCFERDARRSPRRCIAG